MRSTTRTTLAVVATLVASGVPLVAATGTASATGVAGVTRTATLAGQGSLADAVGTAPAGGIGRLQHELATDALSDGAAATGKAASRRTAKPSGGGPNRSMAPAGLRGTTSTSGTGATVVPGSAGWQALNLYEERYVAAAGNQFTVEPPDQGMCVGNGKVFEALNDVVAVYDTAGTRLAGPTSLNTFFGYPPPITRPDGAPYGPFTTDPSCLYDPESGRFFVVELTLETDASTGDFTLNNHLDLAVSQTGDPAGAWNIYRLPVQDDGTQGTPTHPDCPCLGDYPHIGADANGIYISTNEYSWNTPTFNGAQLYAWPKAALVSGAVSVTLVQFSTAGMDGGRGGFTVWPAQTAPGAANDPASGGTEYFLSSNAAEEVGGTYVGNAVVVWSMTGTSSLNTASPSLGLGDSEVPVDQYSLPPQVKQRNGNIPLGSCLKQASCATTILGGPDPFARSEKLSPLDSNDTRMQQVMYSNGVLYGALDTAVTVSRKVQAGIAWYAVAASAGGTTVSLTGQGQVGVAGSGITYPAVGVNADGDGAVAVTLAGGKYYPSAAYLPISGGVVGNTVHVLGAGVGPQDGFSGYWAFNNGPPRPRWGDYGAAAVDPTNGDIWLASEYVAQTCTLNQWKVDPQCGTTRATLGNWSTHIASVTP